MKEYYGPDARQYLLHGERGRSGARPAMVFIHGGGWRGGTPEMLSRHVRFFTSRYDVAGFSIGYRLMPEAEGACTCLADCCTAVRHIRANAARLGVDPERIIACGESAGGYLAACLGTPDIVPDAMARVQAAVCINAVTDLTGKWRYALPGAQADRLASLSPVHRVSAGCAPTYLLHGAADTVTEPAGAVQYHAALVAAGARASLKLLPGLEHAFLIFDYHRPNDAVMETLKLLGTWLDSLGLFVREGCA